MKNFNINNLQSRDSNPAIWKSLLSLSCLILFTIVVSSCDNFVEVDLPGSQLTANTVFEEKATANAAMTDIYSKIRDAGVLTGSASGLSHLLGNYTDELKFYGDPQNSTVAFYNNSLIASNTEIKGLWDSSYNQIYAANAVIEGIDKSVHLPQADKKQLKGEALFVRALLHFYLTNLFGDVPYLTSTDYQQNSTVKKRSVTMVYTSAKEDLELAIQLLPENYVGEDRVRPNKYAAHALLARIDLYAGLWDEASNEASAVLNNTGLYTNQVGLDEIFLKESTTTIWQLAPGFARGNTLESITFNFTSGPPPLSALNDSFMSAFNNNDLRKTHWIKAVTDGTKTWYHPFKYKYSDTESSREYSIIFRLAEIYLIRAEARAQAGELIGAKEDLNKIRNKAGLGDTLAGTQSEILDAILHERQMELFTEFGHRFFDLKRVGKIQSVLSIAKSGWDTRDVLFPIPEVELNLNPNLKPQNSGY
ncbi:SusD-like starch-binding protein associating with outer membrane [Flavobacterium araucananum]|uniref:RagB/SusD family nutrient uptake outer membrane protein n=1 Tax=Flavobacterium araucananum TaxID=946678 RepID=A0A227P321_9FLAO|nr:RagB/SusD family nutrient uptake outer membrane protein [Flavobacterium araucananum]OXG03658.1 RagB/SusD family nutrient uptake outer membrane protein [Flavobacterium araucananum]PWJ96020.1 SusD-like starch-binding protein associating with outer membrane [Flavobacterium araucananum]